MKHMRPVRGFTLVQISIILTVASLVMVAVLPAYHPQLDANKVTTERMNAVLVALRQFQAANGVLPCPADASLAMGSANYGKQALWPGFTYGYANSSCFGGAISANFADTTPWGSGALSNVAFGMVPIRTLGLPNQYAVDGYGRYITYAVDAYATGMGANYPGWKSQPYWCVPFEPVSVGGPGEILVDDNGQVMHTVVALVSHGADGHGAWIPYNAQSGASSLPRTNTGSTDVDQNVNAHAPGGVFPNNYTAINSLQTDSAGNKVTFVKKPATSTFDDFVVYNNSQWNINLLPLSIKNMITFGPPANGVYLPGQALNMGFLLPLPYTPNSWVPFLLYVNNSQINTNGACCSGAGTSNLYANAGLYMYGGAPYFFADAISHAVTLVYAGPLNQYPATSSGAMANSNVWPFYYSTPSQNGSFPSTAGQSVSTMAGVRVSAPSGIVITDAGNVDVIDTLNARISRWSTAGSFINTFGTLGNTVNTGTFTNPSGITVDSSNNDYVVDSLNNRIEIWRPSATLTYNYYFGSYGTTAGLFQNPTGIAMELSTGCGGNPCVWVSDSGNKRLQRCSVASNGATGSCTLYGPSSFYGFPTGVAVDSSFNVFALDSYGRIIEFTAASTWSSTVIISSAGSDNGQLSNPEGIAVDASNNLWVVDSNDNRVEEFTAASGYAWAMTIGGGGVCKSGSCTLNASGYPNAPTVSSPSTANNCYNGASAFFDGCASGGGQLYFNNPAGIAYSSVSGTPSIYVTDTNNSRVQVINISTNPPTYTTSFGSFGTSAGNQFNF
jgi:sugar lactone lactonase YvrE/type II secretory pathway pseudopilin PulG